MTKLLPWKIPKMWNNQTVILLAGGPSLKEQDLGLIKHLPIIGINNSYLLGEWVDVCFFGDEQWYNWHRQPLKSFGGLKVTCHPRNTQMQEVLHVEQDHSKKFGISKDPSKIIFNYNSGSASINLACCFGAKNIILIGFDMCNTNEDTHWHKGHWEHLHKNGKPNRNIIQQQRNPYDRFLKGFNQIEIDVKKLKVNIYNCSLNSAIPNFPKCTLKEALLMCKE